jgi:DNA-binding MarR family transcriptional regulator
MVNPVIPEPGEGKRGEGGYLGYLLRQAAAAHRLVMDRRLGEAEVTTPQFLVLTMIRAYPGASSADIARLTQLTPQTTGVIIANLEKAGLVAKAPHPVHGRILVLSLTAAGEAVLAACKARAGEVEAALVDGFSPEEMAVIRRWLVKVGTGDV